MFLQRKQHLRNLKRIRVSEGRDLEKGLRLDRNERVDLWPRGFLSNVFSEKPDYYLSVYPDNNALYRKLGNHLGVDSNQLMLTSGIDGAIKTIFEIVTAPGDIVGVLSPTYAMYKVYSDMFQVRLFEVGYLPDFRLDSKKLDELMDLRPSVFFIPNPNQPIESAFSLNELDVLAKRAHKISCLLVIDEAYHMFGSDSALSLVDSHPNVVITRTFSKGFGVPSIRLGYIVSTADNMEVLGKTRFAHESNSLSNAVAEYLLDHYRIVEDYIQQVIEGREMVKKELTSMGIRVHGNKGNYLLIDLKTPEIAQNIVKNLRERWIYVKGPWSAPWDRYITITLGPVKLMRPFIAAMAELGEEILTKERTQK